MALQFRRGDDADRTSVTPLAGEPLWIEDTQELYVGDGTTAGGILITGGGGSGDVATDPIWDAKGDLAAGTGSNTAQKLTVGANDTFLVAASAQTTGLEWRAIAETDLPLATLTGVIASPEAITFDTTHTQTPGVAKIQWSDDYGTFQFGLKGGNINLLVGQQLYQEVRNTTGTNMTKGQVVYVSGVSGDIPTVTLANAGSASTADKVLGILAENINNNNNGFLIEQGVLTGVNTFGMTAGALVYLGTSNGVFTATRPAAPNHPIGLGFVLKTSATNVSTDGILYVKVDRGAHLDELHDVTISTVANNHFLVYDGTDTRWENRSPSDARTAMGLGTAATSNTGDFAAASHTHAAADVTSGTFDIARIPTGTTSSTVCIGNDARLSDARTPTAHKSTHAILGTDPLSPTDIGAADAIHAHGNITTSGAIGSTSGLPIKTGTSGVLEAGAFGTSAGQFAEGNHAHGNITTAGAIGSTAGLVVKTTASGVLNTLSLGTAGQVLAVNSGATDIEWVTGGGGGGSTVTLDVQTFTTSGTWTKPANAQVVVIEGTGGGGGGGNGSTTAPGASGCAGLAYQVTVEAAAVGATESVTIGAGGAAGVTGGDSTIGPYVFPGGPHASTQAKLITGGVATGFGSGSVNGGSGRHGGWGAGGGGAGGGGGNSGAGGAPRSFSMSATAPSTGGGAAAITATNGANGNNATANIDGFGEGASGGGRNLAGVGGNGGNGIRGSGGGGGGQGTTAGGTGGTGGDGFIRVITICWS